MKIILKLLPVFFSAGLLLLGQQVPNSQRKILWLKLCRKFRSSWRGKPTVIHTFAMPGIRAGLPRSVQCPSKRALAAHGGRFVPNRRIRPVKKGIMPVFVLGSSRVSNAPAGFFAGTIGAQKMSLIGGEILKQFNIIFDIANNDLYIAPRFT
jgi:hypothetical protein